MYSTAPPLHHPHLQTAHYQWPRLNVARSIFDSVAAAPSLAAAGGSATTAAAAGKEPATATSVLLQASDGDEVGEEWGGDDDLDLTGEPGAAAKAKYA